MAIIIQEEKGKGGGWFGFGVVFIIIAIVGVSAYYLFFVQPDLIDTTVAPLRLKSIEDLKSLNFSPQTVLNGPYFKEKQYIPAPTISQGGNSMPFGMQ